MPSFLRASIVVAAATVGCSAPVVDDVADANGAMTEGIVLVERRVASDSAPQTNVSAKFMRLGTPIDPDMAERVVGTKLDLPAVGSCRAVTLADGAPADRKAYGAADARALLGAIELIDVGDVTVRAGTSVMPLAARAFPDVGDLVSGMFYTSRDVVSDLPVAATYRLEGTGSGLVDRFSIDADAPAALEDVRVGEAALADGVSLDEGASVSVSWRAIEGRRQSARGDVVVIDVASSSGASIRCAFQDEGSAALPGWVLRSSTLGALPASGTLAVHRMRERSFAAPGIDAGEVRFDLSVIGRVTVSPAAWAPSRAARAQP